MGLFFHNPMVKITHAHYREDNIPTEYWLKRVKPILKVGFHDVKQGFALSLVLFHVIGISLDEGMEGIPYQIRRQY